MNQILLGIWFFGWGSASALGTPPASPPRQEVGLQVYLITIGEGKYYWEKYGHNAVAFVDSTRGIDVAFNWGLFDFFEPGFLGRIIRNDLRYWVDSVSTRAFLESYRDSDRSIVVQRLNLTSEQAQKAFDHARWNVREENKYYRYDYYLDNCSTRIRDLLDLALGGALKRATASARVPRTYRTETLRLVDDLKVTQFAIDAALAQPSDKPLTVWENMFVPSRVRDAIRDLKVTDSLGRQLSVVAEERVVHESRSYAEADAAPRLWLPYLIVGLLLAAQIIAVAIAGPRSRSAEVVFRFEVGAWAFLTGLLGVVLLLGWTITEHAFWRRNENLLLLNPLSLFLMVLAPLSLWRPGRTRAAAILAVVVALLSAVALIVKGLPWFAQDNVPMILLLLPPHFAVAYGLWRRSHSPAFGGHPAESR